MNLQDALFNWLQIKLVAEGREEDGAARDTLAFFEEILRDDHKLNSFLVDRADETMYHVRYELDGKSKIQMFDRELADQLLSDINSNPKYNE
ncbi:hypothetical protein [Paenibacillus thalictri]|uniref:Uncharacterized protein n=1 Tax=Paenibacillus thalictri TaxID=2527873 RepID=A0A4Q9DPC2_9BACL|nr:hypothetical protein [Paenibacillus thalictri]TBL78120.1 hypothetical protein EYB31_14640 [Paenibacillus thalictri]